MVTRFDCNRTATTMKTTLTSSIIMQKWTLSLLLWMLLHYNILVVNSFSLQSSSSSSSSFNVIGIKYTNQKQQRNNRFFSTCTSSGTTTTKSTTYSTKTSLSSHYGNTALLKSPRLLSLSSSMTNDNDNNNNNNNNNNVESARTQAKSKLSSSPTSISKSIVSTMTFIIIDILFRRIFKILNISFPSSLGACGIVLSTLLVFQQLQTTSTTTTNINNIIYNWLHPGSIVLSKWLPLFFVPSLIVLPLSFDSIGSITEFSKILFILLSGFIISLYTTALSVVSVSSILSKISKSKISKISTTSTPTTGNEIITYTPARYSLEEELQQTQSPPPSQLAAVQVTTMKAATPAKPFSDALFTRLLVLSGICSVVSIGSMYNILPMLIPTIIKESIMTLFLLSTTITSFVFGARLPKSFTKLIHPLVTCTSITWVTMFCTSLVSMNRFTITKLLLLYKRNNLSLLKNSIFLYKTGPGDILLFLLGPAVVSLAISMYERRTLIRTNKIEIITAILISTIIGLFGTAYAVQLISISNPYIRLSLLSRNITSPLAIAISTILGGDVSLAVSFVVLTGLLGANFGPLLLDIIPLFKRNSIARGLSIGAASHGLGTAAIVNETDAFPFAAISMALTATIATITVSIPAIRNILIQIALK